MDEKALDALRIGLEESYWYSDDDEKVFNELVKKAEAFDAYHSIISKHIEQQYSHNKHAMVKRFVKIHDEYESGEME